MGSQVFYSWVFFSLIEPSVCAHIARLAPPLCGWVVSLYTSQGIQCRSALQGIMKAITERIGACVCFPSMIERMSLVHFCLAHRQPKAVPPPPQKQPSSSAPPRSWSAAPWSGVAVSPPAPSLLEVMLQEAERESQVLSGPSQPQQPTKESSGQRRKSISRQKSSPTVSR